jgi:hypothetical protein
MAKSVGSRGFQLILAYVEVPYNVAYPQFSIPKHKISPSKHRIKTISYKR